MRKCAVLLQDNKLIAKRSCGDLIAQDAMYYGKCLATLYKSASKVNGEDQSISGNDKILHGLALAELVSYIISKSQDCNESKPTVFKLADLVKIYSTSLTRLGVENTQIHSTDLKKRILAQIPDPQAHKEGNVPLSKASFNYPHRKKKQNIRKLESNILKQELLKFFQR